MRKLLQRLLPIIGVTALVYSLYVPASTAAEAVKNSGYYSSLAIGGNFWYYFLPLWQGSYLWLTCVSVAMILAGVILLRIFRNSGSCVDGKSSVWITAGVMLELVAFLQAWTAAAELRNMSNIPMEWYLSSSLTSEGLSYYYWTETTDGSPLPYLLKGYSEQAWMAVLGAVFLAVGIVIWARSRRFEEEIPVEAPIEEAPVEEPKIEIKEEWGITLYCTVMDIRGDYALVKYDDTGIESEVAIALLPMGIDVGDRLKYENYEFERA